ncbi:MAG: hypothetical protein RLN75_08985, partial [Longimicrobiales bacterium]
MTRTPLPATRALLAGGLLLLAACDAPGEPSNVVEAERAPIQVSAVDVTLEPTGFAWLQPLAAGRADGPLVSGLDPVLEICDQSPTDNVGCETIAASEIDGVYAAEWNTERDWRDHRFELQARVHGIT